MEEKRGSRRSLRSLSNPTLISNLAPLALGMVSLSSGEVSQTHPSEVVKTRQDRVRENTWSMLWFKERQLCMAVSGECALSIGELI